MDTMIKKLPKNSDYNPGQNYSNTKTLSECVYDGFNLSIGLDVSNNPPFTIEYFYKDKTLEVLEREFALKFPGPYQCFVVEQNRRLLEFINIYNTNHTI